MSDIQKKRDLVNELDRKAKMAQECLLRAKADLDSSERKCSHQWGETKYIGHYEPGYRIPSDREQGIELGVDSRPACHVPGREVQKWQRTCKVCGKTETTDRVEKVETKVPRF